LSDLATIGQLASNPFVDESARYFSYHISGQPVYCPVAGFVGEFVDDYTG
jgi:hypothetical protein